MAAVAQHDDGFTNPFSASHQQSFGSYKLGSDKGWQAAGLGDSLGVQHELQGEQPYYQADKRDQSYQREQAHVPFARNNSARPSAPSYDSYYERPARIDSVFDAYADMYAEEDYQEEGGSGEESRGTATSRTRQEHLEPYESHAQSDMPWDERGKSGLYGGGGRGADDRETGWVRDYAFSPAPPVSGYEEDLRFGEDDDEEHGDDSLDHSFYGQPEQSFEASGSSTGQLAPANEVDSNSARDPALRHTQATTSTRTPRISPPLHHSPVHTIDLARLKKKTLGSAVSTPSSPTPAVATSATKGAPEDRLRLQRKTTFRLMGRAKKPPTISAPILPEGFIESLGMETFPLYPGVKPPQHALLSPPLKEEDRPAPSSTPPPRPAGNVGLVPASPRIRSSPSRKASPRPKNIPARAEGSTPPLRDRPISPPVVAQIREQQFTTRGYDDVEPQQPQYAAQQQVYAQQTTSPPRSTHSHPFEQYPRSHTRKSSSATIGSGFRDPWSASRTPSGPPSIRSQSTTHNRTPSYRAGEGGTTANTFHDVDYRKDGGESSSGSSHARPIPTFQLEVADDFEPSPLQRTADQRQGSVSSEYSELSEALPANGFPPSNTFHSAYTPSTSVGHPRKKSVAYALVQPLNLAPRPPLDNRESTASNIGGDVVWGGPTDVSRPPSFASPFQGYAPTIGTTGFRNPFG